MTPRKNAPVKVRSTVRTLVLEYEGDEPALAEAMVTIARNLGFVTPARPAVPEQQPEGGQQP